MLKVSAFLFKLTPNYQKKIKIKNKFPKYTTKEEKGESNFFGYCQFNLEKSGQQTYFSCNH